MIERIGAGLALVGVFASVAQAAPYTGSAPACSSMSTATTCKIDIADFMQSKFSYTYNGKTFTSDSTNLSAAANTAQTSSFRYLKQAGVITYNYASNNVSYPTNGDQDIRGGFMNHPTLPNVLLHSKTQHSFDKGGPLEIFRWAGGVDNAIYVTAEAQWTTGGYNSYYSSDEAPNTYWKNRGYFWADKLLDVTRNVANPNEWIGKARIWTGQGYDVIGANGAKAPVNSREYDGRAIFRSFVRYFPSVSAAERGLNDGGGELPPSGTMEILEIVVQRIASKDAVVPTWYEKFVYARQRLADGSYNAFGLVRFASSQNYAVPGLLKCVNGVPPAGKNNLKCGDDDLLLYASNHYNAFHNATDRQGETVKQWYDKILAGPTKFQNDPKLVRRSNANVDDASLPHNRGGFLYPGNGADAKGNIILGSSSASGGDMVYLQNTTFDQDWYIYPNAKDPLYAPAASPTNYCREGYRFLGSFVVPRSFNGLTQTDENPGHHHYAVACGTGSNLLLQASNAGDAPCPASYVTRGWFAIPAGNEVTTCTAGGGCTNQQNKGYLNFCVSATETKFQYPAPYR